MPVGRKPKPRALRVLEGNPGRRPLPPPEPSPKPLGRAPKELSDEQRATWQWVSRECPWLRRADRLLVEAFCRSWTQMVVADRRLVELVEGGNDLKEFAVVQHMLNHARVACLRMMAEMGATVTSRARVTDFGRPEQEDPADRFFTSVG